MSADTKKNSNETQRHVNHHVSALDPPLTFHLTDDIVRGFEPGGLKNIIGVLIMVVWLYGTLVLAERRSGYIIILLGSILGSSSLHPHEGCGTCRRQDRQLQRNALLGLDAHRARRDRVSPSSSRRADCGAGRRPIAGRRRAGRLDHAQRGWWPVTLPARHPPAGDSQRGGPAGMTISPRGRGRPGMPRQQPAARAARSRRETAAGCSSRTRRRPARRRCRLPPA